MTPEPLYAPVSMSSAERQAIREVMVLYPQVSPNAPIPKQHGYQSWNTNALTHVLPRDWWSRAVRNGNDPQEVEMYARMYGYGIPEPEIGKVVAHHTNWNFLLNRGTTVLSWLFVAGVFLYYLLGRPVLAGWRSASLFVPSSGTVPPVEQKKQ